MPDTAAVPLVYLTDRVGRNITVCRPAVERLLADLRPHRFVVSPLANARGRVLCVSADAVVSTLLLGARGTDHRRTKSWRGETAMTESWGGGWMQPFQPTEAHLAPWIKPLGEVLGRLGTEVDVLTAHAGQVEVERVRAGTLRERIELP